MGLIILFGLFAGGLICGMPVAFAIGLAAVGGFVYEGLPLFIGFQRVLSGISVFSLLAIPFFIFAGELMMHGGIAGRLGRLASTQRALWPVHQRLRGRHHADCPQAHL